MKSWPVSFTLACLIGLLLSTTVRVSAAEPPQTAGGVLYVSPTGSDSENPCTTPENPCQTVQWAYTQAQAGDTIKLAAGTYTNADIAVEHRFLVVDQPLTVQGGYTPADWTTPDPLANLTTLDGQSQGGIFYDITPNATLTLTGLTLTGSGIGYPVIEMQSARLLFSNNMVQGVNDYTGNWLIALYDSDGSRISGSQFSNSYYGLSLNYCDDLQVDHNRFSDIGGHNLYVNNPTLRPQITDNTFTGGEYGINLNSTQDALVARNTLSSVRNSIYLYGSSSPVVEDNRITGSIAYALYDYYSTSATLRRNVITGSIDSGMVFYYPANAMLENNIVVRSAGTPGDPITGGDALVWESGTGTLRHNTLADNAGSALKINGNTNLMLLNNIISGNAIGVRMLNHTGSVDAHTTLWYVNGVDKAISADSAYNSDGDQYGDPAFIGGSDVFSAYHLGASSAAIDAGVAWPSPVWNLATDIDNQPRAVDTQNPTEGKPDIGADEYAYRLSLTPGTRQTAHPDDPLTFEHTLRNTGALERVVQLTVDSSQPWAITVSPSAPVTLASGQTQTVTVSLTVPANASGLSAAFTLHAVSNTGEQTSLSAEDFALVDLGASLEPDAQKPVATGQSYVYSHTLKNLGGAAGTFSLSLNSSRGWATLLTAGPLTLAPNQSATVEVRVTIPPGAAAGLIETTTLTAVLDSAPLVLDTATDQTPVAAVSGTRYVAPSGANADSNCLLPSAPCQTVQYAYQQALSDDTIKLAIGTYTNPLMTVEGRFLTLNKSINFEGGYTTSNWTTPDPSANLTTIDGEDIGTLFYGTTLSSRLSISGLTLTRSGTNSMLIKNGGPLLLTNNILSGSTSSYGWLVELSGNGGSNISHNTFRDNSNGIYLTSVDNLRVDDNTFTNVINNAIYLVNSGTNSVVTHNTILGGSYGLYFYNISNARVADNTLSNVSNSLYVHSGSGFLIENNSITGSSGWGMHLSSVQALIVRGNTIANNAGEGALFSWNGADSRVENNLFARNGGTGLYWQGGSGSLRHNTIADNGLNQPGTGSGLEAANVTLTLSNNIIAGQAYGIHTLNASTQVTADSTLWYNNTLNKAVSGGSSITSTRDLTGSPAFMGGSDVFAAYHLSANSAAIDAAAPGDLLTDIDGQNRPLSGPESTSAADIGADEYPYTLVLSPASRQTASAGQTVTYQHTLTNTGGLPGTAQLAAVSSLNWPVTVEPGSVALSPGQSAQITLTVSVPPGSDGIADVTTLTAALPAQPEDAVSTQDVTSVGLGVTLAADQTAEIPPSGSQLYTHTLTNIGVVSGTFTLTLNSSLGWANLLTPGPFTLAPGASAQVQVRITPPPNAAAGLTDLTTLTAALDSLPAVSGRLTDTTRITAVSGTRYVDAATGSDSANNCQVPEQPCQTVQWAYAQSVADDEIKLAAGTYTNPNMAIENYFLIVKHTISLLGGYTPANWATPDPLTNVTTLDGEGLGQLIDARTPGTTLTISGLTLTGSNGITLLVDSARLLLSDSRILSGNSWMVYVVNSTGSRISGSLFMNEVYGLQLSNCTDPVVQHNSFTNLRGYALYMDNVNQTALIADNTFIRNANPIYVYSASQLTITRNLISESGSAGIALQVTNGALVADNTITASRRGVDVTNTTGITLRGNIITGSHDIGIYTHNSSALLENNLIARGTVDGVNIYNGTAELRHNTIADNDKNSQYAGSALRVGTNASVQLTNNIFSGSAFGIRGMSATSLVESAGTLWYANTIDKASSAGWSITTTGDVYGDPAFVGGDNPFDAYHLGKTSSAIDAGVVVDNPASATTTDIDAQARPTGPAALDIGADEYAYRLAFSPGTRQTVQPGAVLTFEHTLRNTGALALDIQLGAISAHDWPLTVDPNGPLTLTSGETRAITLSLTIPSDSSGISDTLTVQAVSATDPDVLTVAVEDLALVDLGLRLEPDAAQSVAPGQSVTYHHTLTNLGGASGSFNLTLNSSRGWATLLTPGPLTLAPNQSAAVDVQVTLPAGAAAGLLDTTTLTAVLGSNPGVYSAVTDLTTAAAVSGTRYVDPSGADADNNCLLPDAPCQTIQRAYAQAAAEDVIKVGAGWYTSALMAVEGRFLTVAKTITVAGGYSPADWSTPDPLANATHLDGESIGPLFYATIPGTTLTLSGLTFHNSSSTSIYIDGARLLLSDSQLVDHIYNVWPVQMYNSSQSRITGNQFNNGIYGLVAQNAADLRIEGNTFTGVPQQPNGYAFYAYNSSQVVIANNTISGAGTSILVDSCNDTSIAHNTITNSGSYGMNINYTSGLSVYANRVTGSGNAGIILYNLYANTAVVENNLSVGSRGNGIVTQSSTVVLRHNTIADNDQGGIYVYGGTLDLTNNIIAGNTTGLQMVSNTSAVINADHTLWYNNDTPVDNNNGGVLTATNDLNGSPSFSGGADPLTAYHLGSDSAAIDAGALVDLAEDLEGDPRPTGDGYDIGADEFPASPTALDELTLSGPLDGTVNTDYTFSGLVVPRLTTLPVTYTWSSDHNTTIVHTSGLSDSAVLRWNTPGAHTITVTASNSAGTITRTHTITLSAPPAAALPYSDGFESGILAPVWMTLPNPQGRVRVLPGYGHLSNHAALLDDAVTDNEYGTAALVLTANLANQPDALLDFWWREYGDENHPGDGVFISADYGDNWWPVLSFNDGPQTYQHAYVNLSASAAAHGLTLNDHFQIKFQFYDNYPIPDDGYAIDDVRLSQAVPLSAVTLAGPSQGLSGTALNFSAQVEPQNASTPVTYTWSATGLAAVTHTGELQDSIDLTWDSGGTKEVTVTATNPTGTVSATHTVTLTAAPVISVQPTHLELTVNQGAQTTTTLTLQNTGNGPLTYTITPSSQMVGVLTPINPIAAGASQEITIEANAAAYGYGTYNASLLIESDDPLTPSLTIPVTITVEPVIPGPVTIEYPTYNMTDVDLRDTLRWYPAQFADSYELYLYEAGAPVPAVPTAANLGTAYTPPQPLKASTQYYWTVVARSPAGTSETSSTFTTMALPDLSVADASAPDAGVAGHALQVTWAVTNQGSRATENGWYDHVYLSPNSTLNYAEAVYLGSAANPRLLDAGQGYNQTAAFMLPSHLSGSYYLFVAADGYGQVHEGDETNNLSSAAGPISISKMPADLAVTLTGWAQTNDGFSDTRALGGFPITYTLNVSNVGQLAAETVALVATLPAQVAFQSQDSALPFNAADSVLTWQVGAIQPGQTVTLHVTAQINAGYSGLISTRLEASTTSEEEISLNNAVTLKTTVELPASNLKVSPAGPTLVVGQGQSQPLTATITNIGAAPSAAINISAPPHMAWVTVSPSTLPGLAPGASADVTLTAAPAADLTPGYYRDFVWVNEGPDPRAALGLTVNVTAPRRALAVTVINDLQAPVAGAYLSLTKQSPSVTVTEGQAQEYYVQAQAYSAADGAISLPDLEIGVYTYGLSAPNHTPASATLTVSDGAGTQALTLNLHALPLLAVSPNTPVIRVIQGQTAGLALAVQNHGAAALTGVAIAAPQSLSWVYLSTPASIPDIQPGQDLSFNVFASPPADLPLGIYQDYITVTAAGSQTAQVALTVEVTGSQSRDLQVRVIDGLGQPVSGGSITLIEQALSVQVTGGVEQTFNKQVSAAMDGAGLASFSALRPGAYNYVASVAGFDQGLGQIMVEPGDGPQQAAIMLTSAPFIYDWTVVPTEDEYQITLTLTYDLNSAEKPYVLIPPRYWSFNQCDTAPIEDVVTIYNASSVILTLDELSMSAPGVSIAVGAHPSTIAPNGSVSVPVTVTKTGPVLAPGSVDVSFSYQEVSDDFVTFTFNPSSIISPVLAIDAPYTRDYAIKPAVFDPAVTYTMTLTPPAVLDWVNVSMTGGAPGPWTSATSLPVALSVTPPEWLAEGVYSDRAVLHVDGSDGSWREGYLNIEITRAANGYQVHTSFELGPIPSGERTGVGQGYLLPGEYGCGTSSSGIWTWTWAPTPGSSGGPYQLIGSGSSSGVTPPPFPVYIAAPPLITSHNQVRLEIEQRLMMEGEGFNATLRMDNTSAAPIQDISVDVYLTAVGDSQHSSGFNITPPVPTALGDIAVGGSAQQNWLILPNDLGDIPPEGKVFSVRAMIYYTWGGTLYSEETYPETITVYPAPDLVIDYELPPPACLNTVFDLKTSIVNQGAGPARNLRFSSAQPRVTDNVTNLPIGFAITETFVNGVSHGPSLDLSLGDLPPGSVTEVVWRIESNMPGRFIEFTSDYRQVNYSGLLLNPLVSEINTFFSEAACTSMDMQNSSFTAEPVEVRADGAETSDFTLTLKSLSGEPLVGKEITFKSSRGDLDDISQPDVPTNSSGQAFGQVSSLVPGQSQFTVTNVTDGVTLSDVVTVTFTPLNPVDGETVDAINRLSKITIDGINLIADDAASIAPDGDYFRAAVGADKAKIVTDVVFGVADVFGGMMKMDQVRYALRQACPGCYVPYLANLSFKEGHPYAARLLDIGLFRPDSALGSKTAELVGWGGSKFISSVVGGVANFGARTVTKEAAKKTMVAVTMGQDDGMTSVVLPALMSTATDLKSVLVVQRDELIGQLPLLTIPDEAAYREDLAGRMGASLVMSNALSDERFTLHDLRAQREDQPNPWLNFVLRFAAKSLAGYLADGPGTILVGGALSVFDTYMDGKNLGEDEQMYSLATGALLGAPDALREIYANTASAFDPTKGLPANRALGQINWVHHYSLQEPTFLGLSSKEIGAYSEISLTNQGQGEVTYLVKAKFYTDTTRFGLPWAAMERVEESTLTLAPSATGIVKVEYLRDAGKYGFSPRLGACLALAGCYPATNIIIEVLGTNDTGIYFIDNDWSSWAPAQVMQQPIQLAGRDGSGVNLPTFLAEPAGPRQVADSQPINAPLTSYVLSAPWSPVHTAQLWVSNPFDRSAFITVTQPIPAGITLVDLGGADVVDGSLVWRTAISPNTLELVSFTFNFAAAPGTENVLEPATLRLTLSGSDQALTDTSAPVAFQSTWPVTVEHSTPQYLLPGAAASQTVTIKNWRSSPLSGDFAIRIVSDDEAAQELFSAILPFAADSAANAGSSATLEFSLPTNLPKGSYLLKGEIRLDGSTLSVYSDRLQVGLPGPVLAYSAAPGGAAQAGDVLTYTLGFSNTTGAPLTGAMLHASLPICTTLVPGSLSAGGAQVADDLQWTLPAPLPKDAPVSVSFAVSVNAGCLTPGQTSMNLTSSTSLSAAELAPTAGPSVTVLLTETGETPISGLTAANDGPTLLGAPTVLSAQVAAGDNITYVWDFGDGTAGQGAQVTHTYASTGTFDVQVTASNNANTLHASTRVIVHRAPNAGADALEAVEDTPLTLSAPGVLGNDSDPDGSPLTVSAYTQPERGTLELNPDGSLRYTPAPNDCAAVSFTYTVSDSQGASASGSATITISCVNDEPIAVNDRYDAVESTPLVISAPGVLANDSDPDGDLISLGDVMQPTNAHGRVMFNSDGGFTYQPAPRFCGVDTFTYIVHDQQSSAVGVVTINVTCDPGRNYISLPLVMR